MLFDLPLSVLRSPLLSLSLCNCRQVRPVARSHTASPRGALVSWGEARGWGPPVGTPGLEGGGERVGRSGGAGGGGRRGRLVAGEGGGLMFVSTAQSGFIWLQLKVSRLQGLPPLQEHVSERQQFGFMVKGTHTHTRLHTHTCRLAHHTLTHGDPSVACRLLHFLTFIADKPPNPIRCSDDPKIGRAHV